MRKILVGLISAVVVLAFGSPASAIPSQCDAIAGNLVSNCGFELAQLPSGQPPDWTFTPASLGSDAFVTNGAPHSGAQNYDFGANNEIEDVLSQTLTTNAGTMYTVDFFYSFTGDAASELTVKWGSTTLYDVIGHANSGGYTELSFTALGTGSDTLSFGAYDHLAFEFLDDVSVVAKSTVTGVPEPLTLSLFGAGLAGAAAMRRRKPKST